MLTILAVFILVFAFKAIFTPLLWVAGGKIFKIDNLTFKKAFLTYLLLLPVLLIFKIVGWLEPSSGIPGIIFGIFISVTYVIFVIWIIKIRFDTTILRSIGVYLVPTICFLGLALFVQTYVAQAYNIPSGAMKPTLQIGDQILVNKFTYDRANPNRGDIIVFKFPVDPEKDFIKRVIGVGGDIVEGRDKKIYVNNQLIDDNYSIRTDPNIIPHGVQKRDNFGPITVPQNSLFVLGDNRDQSFDSRFWGFVDLKVVKGKAFMIYWSWDRDKYKPRLGRIGSKIR